MTSEDLGRFAVIVGRNQGADPDRRLKHAEQDAEKVAGVLSSLGGFPTDQIQLLSQASANDVRRALKHAEARIARYRRETGKKAMLLFYYSGHAAGFELELGTTTMAFADLRARLERSEADVRLAFLDSCQSGGLIAPKGGHRTADVRITSVDELQSKGYAIITSSDRDELSQESEEIRGAFFSHYLVSALRGAADESQDGQVTLGEAYDYVYRHTVAHTGATVGGIQHPMYDLQLQGRGEIVLTRLPSQGPLVEAQLPRRGRLLVLDADRKHSFLELDLSASKDLRFALEPGTYEVFWLRDKDVRRARLDTRRSLAPRLSVAQFEEADLQRSVAKGGLFAPDPEHRLRLSFLGRTWPLADRAVAAGAMLEYRLALPGALHPLVRAYGSTHEDSGYSTGYFDLGLGAGMAYALRHRSPRLWVGPVFAYEHLFQDRRDGNVRHTPGFAYLAAAGIEFLEPPLPLTVGVGAGGRIFRVVEDDWVHRFSLQLTVGTGLDL